MKIKKLVSLGSITAVTCLAVLGCGTSNSSGNSNGTGTTSSAAFSQSTEQKIVSQPAWYTPPTTAQKKLAKTLSPQSLMNDYNGSAVYSPSPYPGETAYPVGDIHITSAQLAKIKAGHYTLALAMHYMTGSYSQQIVKGVQEEAKALGIKVVTITNANFSDTAQISDLQAIAARKPDITIGLPVNTQTESTAFKNLAATGSKIVFIDQPAQGMTAGKDYVSVVTCDNYGNGMAAADLLAKDLHDKGNITVVYFNDNFPVLNQRYEGFTTRIMYKYPNIHIVGVTGITGPNDGTTAASALLTKYPNTQGMWVPWSNPAEGAVSAVKEAGKNANNFTLTTMDLDSVDALSIAQNGIIKGLGAQRPVNQAEAAVEEGALALIGVPTHPYVVESALPIDHSNISSRYSMVFHAQLTSQLQSALKQ